MNILPTITRREFARRAQAYLGHTSIRYTTADKGCSLDGFDCSGFIRFLLLDCGIKLDADVRHCNEFFDGFGIFVHQHCATIGDLVFLSRDGVRPTHIGVLLTEAYYIHAPGTTESLVSISPLPTKPIKASTKHPQIYYNNPIGFKRIAVPNGRYMYPLPL